MVSRRPPARLRGFTLLETMMVVVLIAIFAALASPSFIRLMRDRRVNRAAQEVAELYRNARMRSLGRGSAVLVRYSATGGTLNGPLYEVREAVTAGTGLPSASCVATNWTNTSTTSAALTKLDGGPGSGVNQIAETKLFDGTTAVTTYEVCFSPRGRTYARASAGGAFAVMNTPPRIDVKNVGTELVRSVFVPPSGVARLAL